MSEYPKIESPEFIDIQKTRVRFLLVAENGVKTVAEMRVPAGEALGVSETWDKIVAEFDVAEMKKRRNNIERKMRIERDLAEKKKKSSIENRILQHLFDKKLQFFNYHFVDQLTYEEKSAVRRASDETLLNVAIFNAIYSYTQRTGKPLLELFDEIEDEQYKQSEATSEPADDVPEIIESAETLEFFGSNETVNSETTISTDPTDPTDPTDTTETEQSATIVSNEENLPNDNL